MVRIQTRRSADFPTRIRRNGRPAVSVTAAAATTGGFTLGGNWLDQRFNERQRARDREAASNAKIAQWGQWNPTDTSGGSGRFSG